MVEETKEETAAGQSAEPTKHEYPFVWRVEFLEGRRTNKTPGERADKAVIEEKLQAIGTVLIAASFSGGREQAKVYLRELSTQIQRVELQAVAQAFAFPTMIIEEAARKIEGEARFEYCALSETFSSSSGYIARKGASGESTVGGVSDRRCEPLRASISNAVESIRFRIGYELLSTVTESVKVAERQLPGQEPIAWPALATKQERPIAPGEGWFQGVDDIEDGARSTEALRPTAEELAAGASSEPTRVLEVTLRNGPLPLQLLRGRGSSFRFELLRTERKLGPLPHESPRDSWAMSVALLLPGTAGGLEADRFVEQIANGAAKEAGPLTPEAVFREAFSAGRELDQLELITIFCPPRKQRETEAKYCIRHACAEFTNGDEFCSELDSEFMRN